MGTPASLARLRQRREALEKQEQEQQKKQFDADYWKQAHAFSRNNSDTRGTRKPKAKSPRRPAAIAIALQAARALPPGPFSLTTLLLAAWRLSPAYFGLPGAEADHPSDRRMAATVFGKRGLVARGLLRRCAEGYEVVT